MVYVVPLCIIVHMYSSSTAFGVENIIILTLCEGHLVAKIKKHLFELTKLNV